MYVRTDQDNKETQDPDVRVLALRLSSRRNKKLFLQLTGNVLQNKVGYIDFVRCYLSTLFIQIINKLTYFPFLGNRFESQTMAQEILFITFHIFRET